MKKNTMLRATVIAMIGSLSLVGMTSFPALAYQEEKQIIPTNYGIMESYYVGDNEHQNITFLLHGVAVSEAFIGVTIYHDGYLVGGKSYQTHNGEISLNYAISSTGINEIFACPEAIGGGDAGLYCAVFTQNEG